MQEIALIVLRPLVFFIVRPTFWFWRWVKNCGSAYLRSYTAELPPRDQLLIRASYPIALPIFFVYRLMRLTSRIFRQEFADYALRQYGERLARHYGKGGLSYREVHQLSEEAYAARYRDLHSTRVAAFIDRHPASMDYRDGDSFLDCGCGLGNEVKELAHRFPTSPIHGFDLNEDAVHVVLAGNRDEARISAEAGSITDFAWLARFPDNSVDHVFLCNVFPYILGEGVAASTAIRQRVVSELIRICRRSALIMTDRIERPRDTYVEVVMNSACFIRDDVPGYFDGHAAEGERLVIYSDKGNAAVLFRKAPLRT